jgi:protein-disulfide isomerase
MEQQCLTPEDHLRGRPDAAVVLIEYADFQCPYSARAHATLTKLQARLGDALCLAYRHLPLMQRHPFAELAAGATEAAALQGKFWELHDAPFEFQVLIDPDQVLAMARDVGLDIDRFRDDMLGDQLGARVRADAERAHQAGVTATPSFFINGERYRGDSDEVSLTRAIEGALQAARRSRG